MYYICAAFFYVVYLLSFNVQTLLLKQILTVNIISIILKYVAEIVISQKAWIIHGHHDSFYYHFYSRGQENPPLDIMGGKDNGNPIQSSCLENPMDGGAC